MAVPSKHGLYFVGLGAATLGGISRQNLATGIELRGEANSGELYARFQALYAAKLAPGFTTNQLKAALDVAGTLGKNVADLAGGLCLYAQKHADGATRAAGANHRKYAFAKGILAPRRISVDHRGDATIEYDAVVTSADGSTDPVSITDSVSLPGAVADGGRWTLGPTTLGGKLFTGKRTLSIEFGIDAVAEASDSDLYDTFASIRAVNSRLTLRGTDVQWLKSNMIPLTGLACTYANSKVFLRKRAAGSTFVADGTAEHIKLIPVGTAVVDNALDVSEGNAAEVSISVPLYFDGTNAPLTIDTASAIT